MNYDYKCNNIECKDRNKEVSISKPMMQSDREEKCEVCGEPLQRIFGIGGHATFSDGYKS